MDPFDVMTTGISTQLQINMSVVNLSIYILMCIGAFFLDRKQLSLWTCTAPAFIYGIMARTGKSYAQIRWGVDGLCLIAGVCLGGSWGLGTVVSLLAVGKLMEAFQRMIWRLRAAGESLDARERQLGFQKMIEVALETV